LPFHFLSFLSFSCSFISSLFELIFCNRLKQRIFYIILTSRALKRRRREGNSIMTIS
jgi:hypothetical protein